MLFDIAPLRQLYRLIISVAFVLYKYSALILHYFQLIRRRRHKVEYMAFFVYML
jgi:hypothetical protein